MEREAVIITVLNMKEDVVDCLRRLLAVEFQDDLPHVCLEHHARHRAAHIRWQGRRLAGGHLIIASFLFSASTPCQ